MCGRRPPRGPQAGRLCHHQQLADGSSFQARHKPGQSDSLSIAAGAATL